MSISTFFERLEGEAYNSPNLVGFFGALCFLFLVLVFLAKGLASILLIGVGGACLYFWREQINQESSKGRTSDSESDSEGSNPSS